MIEKNETSNVASDGKEASRRRFLKQTIFGSIVLAAGNIFQTLSSPGAGTNSFQFLSPYEFKIMKSVASRIIGPLDDSIPLDDIVARADIYLATSEEEVQDQFHQLLTVFNAPFFTFLFDWRFSSFLNMSPEDQDSYLEDWMTSVFAFRRTGFQALKRVCLSMVYTDSRSFSGIGYGGLFLPWER